jgi:hypothetical protein
MEPAVAEATPLQWTHLRLLFFPHPFAVVADPSVACGFSRGNDEQRVGPPRRGHRSSAGSAFPSSLGSIILFLLLFSRCCLFGGLLTERGSNLKSTLSTNRNLLVMKPKSERPQPFGWFLLLSPTFPSQERKPKEQLSQRLLTNDQRERSDVCSKSTYRSPKSRQMMLRRKS